MSSSLEPSNLSPPGGTPRHGIAGLPALPLGRTGVVVVDDDESVCLLVQDILARAREFRLAGVYSSTEAALTGIPQSGGQVVLMEVKMPGMSGIECARRLKALLPRLVIVMITGMDDAWTIDRARECADDFLLKPLSAGQVLVTLKFWRPDRTAKTMSVGAPWVQSVERLNEPNVSQLTPKEGELLEHLAGGHLYKEIATKMGLTESVVRNRAHQLYLKLRVSNRTEAASWWWNQRRR